MTTSIGSAPSCAIGHDGHKGPLTRARQRRALSVYLALTGIGLLPWFVGASPALQAGGLGLMLPGAGFIAVGGWWLLLVPVALLLFGVSLVAWFGTGMVVAPIGVWLGTALLAAALAGNAVRPHAPWVALALTALVGVQIRRKSAAALAADLKLRDERRAYLPAMLQRIEQTAVAKPDRATREHSAEQLSALRYCLDRALQPVGTLNGFTKIDQFQTPRCVTS